MTEEVPFDVDDGDDDDEDFVPRGKNDERTGTVKAKSNALPTKVTDKKKTDKNAGDVHGTPGNPKVSMALPLDKLRYLKDGM